MIKKRLSADRGVTLVEVLLAVAIMSIAVVGLMTGLGVAVRTSGQHRSQANVAAVTVSVTESIKGQAYDPCPPDASYSTTTGVTYPSESGFTPANVSVAIRYWNDSTSAFQFSCPGGGDDGMQEIRIVVGAPDGRASQTLAFVKRDPA